MKLSTYMEDNRLGDADMADLIGGCSYHSVKKWRSGERIPRGRFMVRIREVTNGQVNANDFVPSVSEEAA